MKFDIITIGSAVIDAFLETGLPEKGKDICFPIGHKLVMQNLWFATGGGATNTATAFSKLGLKTGCIANLGKDTNAEKILAELQKQKIKFLGNQIDKPTGFSVIVDSAKHNRTILTFKGANEHLDFNKLKLRNLKTKWFYFSSMQERSLKTQEKLALWASKRNIKIAYNPSSYLTKKGANNIKKILRHITILVLNKGEAEDLVGKKSTFEKLHSLGPKTVCITFGKKGNSAFHEGKLYKSEPNNIKVIERTGAGDAFASGFVAGIIKTNDIKKAMQIGSINAESVITKPGAKNGLLMWEQIKKKIR